MAPTHKCMPLALAASVAEWSLLCLKGVTGTKVTGQHKGQCSKQPYFPAITLPWVLWKNPFLHYDYVSLPLVIKS